MYPLVTLRISTLRRLGKVFRIPAWKDATGGTQQVESAPERAGEGQQGSDDDQTAVLYQPSVAIGQFRGFLEETDA